MSGSVYQEIGGREAVERVVDDFYEHVLADDRLVEYFEGTDMADLRAHQVQFISAVTGGPVEYSGAEMREAHADLDIGQHEFDLVVGYLERALRENGVPDEQVAAIRSKVRSLEDPVLNR
jgi:hemoglobin